jgi:hypothetical protein
MFSRYISLIAQNTFWLLKSREGMASIVGLRGMKEHNVRKRKLAAAVCIAPLTTIIGY